MAEHPNATRIRELFAALRQADINTVHAIVRADAVWHFPGRHGQLAGSHEGRDAIVAFLMKVMALTEGTFHLDFEDVLANDTTAIALFRGHATRAGRTLDNPTCLRLRLEQGQVFEMHEFVWDLYQVDDFWS